MKARSRQAPVRMPSPRNLPPVHGASVTTAPAPNVGISSAQGWERWLDRRAGVANLLDLARCESPTPSLLPGYLDAILSKSNDWPFAFPRPWAAATNPATASALRSPDIGLWNREPFRDMSGSLSEVVRVSVAEGLRVLVIVNRVESLDNLLGRFAGDADFLAIRYLAPGERASNGPLTRFGVEEQRQALRGRLLARIGQMRADAQARRDKIAEEDVRWQQLGQLARDLESLESSRQRLRSQTDAVPVEVRREAMQMLRGEPATGPFASAFDSLTPTTSFLAQLGRELSDFREQRDSLERTRSGLSAESDDAERRLTPWQRGAWWTFGYWAARFDADLRPRSLRLADRLRECIAELDRIRGEIEFRQTRLETAATERQRAIDERIDAEIFRRKNEIERQIAILDERWVEIHGKWITVDSQLGPDRPIDTTVAAWEIAYSRWRECVVPTIPAIEAEVNPQDLATEFLSRLPRLIPVVVGTARALTQLPEFAETARSKFDLIVVDDAEQFRLSELLDMIGRAPRALLLGAAAAVATPFGQAWRSLHRTAPPANSSWSRTNRGLVCTLVSVDPSQVRFVESERLTDEPDIELRILAMPKRSPQLAEVVFPPETTVAAAKTILFRELQEAAVDSFDRPAVLIETPEGVSIAWSNEADPAEFAVELEPGVREWFVDRGDRVTTLRLEFAGWNRAAVCDWLRRRLPGIEAVRTFDAVASPS